MQPPHRSHEELLSASGLYAEIYYRQLRPQEETRPAADQGNNGNAQDEGEMRIVR